MASETIKLGALTISIRKDMEEIVPEFINNRRIDATTLPEVLARGDYKTLRITGHNLAGTGAAYGFQVITDIGRSMEAAALEQDAQKINGCLSALAYFVKNVEVIYV